METHAYDYRFPDNSEKYSENRAERNPTTNNPKPFFGVSEISAGK